MSIQQYKNILTSNKSLQNIAEILSDTSGVEFLDWPSSVLSLMFQKHLKNNGRMRLAAFFIVNHLNDLLLFQW